MFVLRYMT